MKLFIFLSICLVFTTAQTYTLKFLPSRDDLYCNDGSPAGFYWLPASNPNKTTRYMVFLQGGAWCWDQASCASRWQSSPSLMSSKSWAATSSHGSGIFTDADWAGSNIAYVMYCSSDAWLGTKQAGSDTYGWYFNGKNIVKEVFNQLILNYGMNQATEILFTGCSAGGRGVLNNVDSIADFIRPSIPSTAVYKGFPDSAWWLLDFPLYPGVSTTTLVQQAQGSYSLAGSIPNQACADLYGKDSWQCGFPSGSWPFIKTDVAYNLFEFDEWQLSTTSNGIFPWTNSPQMTDQMTFYAMQFMNITKFTLQPPGESNRNLFASACYSHCSTESSNYYNVKVGGISLSAAISNWFFRNQGFQLVDTCNSWKCGTGCPM